MSDLLQNLLLLAMISILQQMALKLLLLFPNLN